MILPDLACRLLGMADMAATAQVEDAWLDLDQDAGVADVTVPVTHDTLRRDLAFTGRARRQLIP